jgi:sugar-specific transcriptional regulator TrmB
MEVRRERMANFKNEELEMLNLLGLTTRQAEVYVTIVQLGPSRITTIAKNAQIERSEVFRVMPILLELGLVRKILTNPVTYEALAMSDGITVLLEQANEEHEAIKVRAHQIVQLHKERILEKKGQEDPKYFLVYGQKAEDRELVETLKKVENTIDCIVKWNRFLTVIDQYFELFEKALKRGVTFRLLTDIPKHQKVPKKVQALKRKGVLEFRRLSAAPPVILALVDGKNSEIVTYDSLNSESVTSLWSTDRNFVTILRDYFNIKWKLAAQQTETEEIGKIGSLLELKETYRPRK